MLKRFYLAAATLLTVAAGSLGLVAMTAASAPPASALCAASPIQGDWHNINAGTQAMTRVIVETCQSVTTCNGNVCSTQYDAATFLHPYGACTPSACDWGRKQADSMGDGWLRSTHAFGFKTSSVWIKTYQYYGLTYLRVWVYNDFAPSDGRADYTTDEWFLK